MSVHPFLTSRSRPVRRAALAVTAGVVLLGGAACDTGRSDAADAGPSTAAAPVPVPSASSAPPDFSVDTAQVCDEVERAFTVDLKPFGTYVGRMIAHKEAKQATEAGAAEASAAKVLRTVGGKVRRATADALDPELKAAGSVTARKLERGAKDGTFFDKVKSTKDLDRTIRGQMEEWLSPVAGYCA